MRTLAGLMPICLVFFLACDSGVFESGDGGGPSNGWGDGSSGQTDGYVWPYSDTGGAENPDPNPPDPTCGGQTIPIELKQGGAIPDLFLVVDISGSMSSPIDIFNFFETKWIVMRKTLLALVDHFKTNIRFGLSLFPADDGCAPGTIDVPLQTGNYPAIESKLKATSPMGWTPTPPTLANVHSYLNTVPPGQGERFVLLATDGMPNCGATEDTETGPETLAEVQSLFNGGVKTFVVGFGGFTAGNAALLNQLATAGGAPNPTGPNKFYPAKNEQELKAAFFGIAGGIIPAPCTYKLASQPEDPENVTVKFDGQAVPRDKTHKTGWDYTGGGTEITFFGPDCDRVSMGQVQKVEFIFGCKGPVIE